MAELDARGVAAVLAADYIRAYVYCDSRYVYSEVVTATTESLSLDDELKNYVAPTSSL